MEWNTQHTLITKIITIIVWNCRFSILCFCFALSRLFNLFCDIPMFAATISKPAAADPNFSKPIQNITIPVGREAVLTCEVHELSSYKVRMNLTIHISTTQLSILSVNYCYLSLIFIIINADATVCMMSLIAKLILEFIMHTIRNMWHKIACKSKISHLLSKNF